VQGASFTGDSVVVEMYTLRSVAEMRFESRAFGTEFEEFPSDILYSGRCACDSSSTRTARPSPSGRRWGSCRAGAPAEVAVNHLIVSLAYGNAVVETTVTIDTAFVNG